MEPNANVIGTYESSTDAGAALALSMKEPTKTKRLLSEVTFALGMACKLLFLNKIVAGWGFPRKESKKGLAIVIVL
jgi:hypothetical protein